MTMQVQPYLFFEGRCEEAAQFYSNALGAEIAMLMRYKDGPKPSAEQVQQGCGGMPPGNEEKIMHMSLKIGDSTVLASDGYCSGKPDFKGISLALSPSSDDEAKRLFTALAEQGQICMPLDKTFFASSFGVVTDKFGVSWMIVVSNQAAASGRSAT